MLYNDIVSDNKEEREKYKDILLRQKNAIEQLLDMADQHARLFDNVIRKSLSYRMEECERLYRKLDRNEFEIAIVGLEKAGKSTFANALIENKILPDAEERCTYTSTCIKYGVKDKATVSFYSVSEFDRKIQDYLETLEVEKPELYTLANLTKEAYSSIYSKLDPKTQKAYEFSVNSDLVNILNNKNALMSEYLGKDNRTFDEKEMDTDEFKRFIIDKNVAIAVKEVVIESSKLDKMSNAIVYDVPGFDSPTLMHEVQTAERMKKADAIILIASAAKPSMTAPSLNMFNKVVDDDNIELSEKLFIFANKADASNTLQKNINTLKEEALKYHLLSENKLSERLLIGSAKARLQDLDLEDGKDCISKLNEGIYAEILTHGDGIKNTYDSLVEYNNTERFSVLKKKVKRNEQEIRNIFQSLREKYNDSDLPEGDFQLVLAENDRIREESKNSIIDALEKLRYEVRSDYTETPMLSNSMKDKIKSIFANDKYKVTQQVIDEAKIKIGGNITYDNIEEVERYIRQLRFPEIYSEFSDTIIKIAADDHKKYYDKVIDIFENSLNLNKNSSDYEIVSRNIEEYVNHFKTVNEDDDSYQTLIERFVRDLVEILIGLPYGHEARMNRFLVDIGAFSGLMMFYTPENKSVNYNRIIMSIAPKDQPLMYSLLFHEYKDAIESSKAIFEYLCEISDSIYSSALALQLICSIIKRNPKNAFDIIKNHIDANNFRNTKPENIVNEVTARLRSILAQMNSNESGDTVPEFDFTFKEKFEEQYKKYFGSKKKREYKDMAEDFSDDLAILKDFLLSASIPAICIEKPFIAKEVKAIEGLKRSVESSDYTKFIRENAKYLIKDTYTDYQNLQYEHVLNKQIIREIDRVLNSMSDD